MLTLTMCGLATVSVVAHADVETTPVSAPPNTIPPFPTPTVDPLAFNRTIDISPTKGKPGTVIQVSGDCGSPYHQLVVGLVSQPLQDGEDKPDPNGPGPLVGGELVIFGGNGDGKTQTFDGTLTVPAATPAGLIYVGGVCWYPGTNGYLIATVPFKVTGPLVPIKWPWLNNVTLKTNLSLELLLFGIADAPRTFVIPTTTTAPRRTTTTLPPPSTIPPTTMETGKP